MKKLIIIIIAILTITSLNAQTFDRLSNESADAFAERVLKVASLQSYSIEKGVSDTSSKKIIFASVLVNGWQSPNYDPDMSEGIAIACLFPINDNSYKLSMTDTFWEDGNSHTNVKSIFFVDVAKNKNMIALLTQMRWGGGRFQEGGGITYNTSFYKYPSSITTPKKLSLIPALTTKFSNCTETDPASQGKISHCKFQTESSIRNALRSMGN